MFPLIHKIYKVVIHKNTQKLIYKIYKVVIHKNTQKLIYKIYKVVKSSYLLVLNVFAHSMFPTNINNDFLH